MRIAYLSGAYVPSQGANSMHVMRMCNAMAQRGHTVELHARQGDIPADDDFVFYGVPRSFTIVKTVRPPVRYWGAAISALRVLSALRRRDLPDLIYAREYWALAVASGLDVPYVLELHWIPKGPHEMVVQRALFRQPNFRRAVFISEALRARYLALFSELSIGNTLVAHDAADLPDERATAVTPWPQRPSALQVGYVGSFWPGYGIDVIEQLAARLADCDFHVVGGRDEEVSPRRRRATSNLHYHGFVPPRDLPGYYARFDVVVAPYQPCVAHIEWISPMKLFEYMAHGKAIVCSNFPVLREIITDGVTGLLLEATCLDAWVEALHSLDRDRRRVSELGEAARARLAAEHTWLRRASQVLEGLDA
jgi:glycosyltransferase involved in cell wall biosynthesis